MRSDGGVFAVVVGLALVAGACSSSSESTSSTTAKVGTTLPPAPVDYGGLGPYQVGTLEVDLGDRKAVVYYPADPAAWPQGRRRPIEEKIEWVDA